MTNGGKGTPEQRIHSIRWDADDWERINRCAERLAEETHMDVGPVDVIRAATRSFCADKLGPVTVTEKASL